MQDRMELTITHLYPEKMNLYGDLGNVTTLKKRAEWRGIDVNVQNISFADELRPGETDIYFFGGGQDKDQLDVFQDLVKNKKQALLSDLEDGVCMLAICGGYQLLGEYFLDSAGNKIEGLGFLPLETVAPGPELKQRAIGNLVTQINTKTGIAEGNHSLQTLVGFENHSGRTRIKKDATGEIDTDVLILGKVLVGEGDNEDGHSDGVVYKNTIGSYMHGSLLPKNPHLADFLIKKALERKYNSTIALTELDDNIEVSAHKYILERYKVNN